VWDRSIDGKTLTFRLWGINNHNFIMRDEETGTWWQQVSGEAIQGPLKGRKLAPVYSDEVSFEIWRGEKPQTRVLRPDARFASQYVPDDWEKGLARLPVVTKIDPADTLKARDLVIGIDIDGRAKAYPFELLAKQHLIIDMIGSEPIAIVLGDDGRSVRAFRRKVGERTLELFAKPQTKPLQLIDAETATVWDFSGRAASGGLVGTQLSKITALKDYWFDWKTYHPQTKVYALGARSQ
jgi:hypothetical protein